MGLTQTGTDGLKDDAISLAKMAAGTDGQIITYDASGNPTAVGPGTDGQVLTSTGAGSPPAFETAAGGLDGVTTGSGNVTITDGNLIVASGHGIDFSATGGPTNGTGTQELLDDYEEGTWTPTFNATGTNPTITAYGNQSGWYEKIGRFVHCTWNISVTDANWASDGTGYLCIGGFPFTPEWMIMYPLRNTGGWAAGSGYIPYGGYTDGGSTSAGALIRQSSSGESALNFAQRSGNMYIYTTCTYKTAL
tara:strand:- start:19291 stop:20037 length:747 start_codon:yes stop_codon:yes gene_type:complete